MRLLISSAVALLTATGAVAADAHYTLDPARSTLDYQFTQAGALNKGRFTRYTVALDVAGDAPSRLDVLIEINSLDTGDKERDDTLKGADLLAAARFPQSHFASTQITRTASGYDAVGKLTIRGMTRDVHVPFTFSPANGSLLGKVTIERLDYGVGQGDWKATDQVGNDVAVTYALHMVAAH